MLRTTRWVAGLGGATAGLLLLAGAARADDPKPKAGDPFPDVPVPATQIELVKKGGTALSVADLKGKMVVVAFYPKALTGG